MVRKVVQDSAQIPLIDEDLLTNLFCCAFFRIAYLVEYTSLCEGEWTIQEMLIQKSDDIGIETIEASNSVDSFLLWFHSLMIFKILDFVKYFCLHEERRKILLLEE